MPPGSSALARAYRRFAEVASDRSPLYERVALALSGSYEVLGVIQSAPPSARRPESVLAALRFLALSGRAPELAAAYAARDAAAAASAALDALLDMGDEVVAIAASRKVRTQETGHHGVLYPAIAEAARRLGATSVGLIGVGGSAGLDLCVDRVAVDYGDGRSLGDPASPVRHACAVVGRRQVPSASIPRVVARVCLDPDPLDVTDEDDARWLRACVWPDQTERAARLEAEMSLTAAAPPLMHRGDVVEDVPDALARVPADALPVVFTTWALPRLALERRVRLVHRLVDAAADRPVAWVSVEGVGVAPTVPTLGDRRASGHSIVGVTTFERSALHAEAVGRCWSRGRMLEWLAG